MSAGEGSSSGSRTIFVGGLAPHMTEAHLVSYFSTYGDILDVQLPRPGRRGAAQQQQEQGQGGGVEMGEQQAPHKGFGFVDFATSREAEDAIDNMHLNEVEGRIISVNLAKPNRKDTNIGGGNPRNRAIWQDEEWIKQYGTEQGVTAPEAIIEDQNDATGDT